jgi:hypothetical protein
MVIASCICNKCWPIRRCWSGLQRRFWLGIAVCCKATALDVSLAVGMSGPPPGEVVEGLRNPYLDQYVPPRRREPSETYKNYKPLRPQYVHLPLAEDGDPVDALVRGVQDLSGRVTSGVE